MPLFWPSLHKIYIEAYDARTEEDLWYHFWTEVFTRLNESSRSNDHRLSIAPQRRYSEGVRKSVAMTREQRVETRSQQIQSHQVLGEDEDMEGDASFSSDGSGSLRDSKEDVYYRIPDFSIIQYQYSDNSLTTKVIVEDKPLLLLPKTFPTTSTKEQRLNFEVETADALIASTLPQVREQLTHFFADTTEDRVILIITAGPWYESFDVTRYDFKTILANEDTAAVLPKFALDSHDEIKGINPHLVNIWSRIG